MASGAPGTDVTIRTARLTDSAIIATILRELGFFESLAEESPQHTEKRVAQQLELCNTDDSYTVLVAELAADIAYDFVSVHWLLDLWGGLDGYISELFILSDFRGQGIEERLLKAVRVVGLAKGASRLMLFNRKIWKYITRPRLPRLPVAGCGPRPEAPRLFDRGRH